MSTVAAATIEKKREFLRNGVDCIDLDLVNEDVVRDPDGGPGLLSRRSALPQDAEGFWIEVEPLDLKRLSGPRKTAQNRSCPRNTRNTREEKQVGLGSPGRPITCDTNGPSPVDDYGRDRRGALSLQFRVCLRHSRAIFCMNSAHPAVLFLLFFPCIPCVPWGTLRSAVRNQRLEVKLLHLGSRFVPR